MLLDLKEDDHQFALMAVSQPVQDNSWPMLTQCHLPFPRGQVYNPSPHVHSPPGMQPSPFPKVCKLTCKRAKGGQRQSNVGDVHLTSLHRASLMAIND